MSTSEVPRQTAEAAVSPTAVQQQERLTESARVLRVRRFPPVVQFLTPLDEAERAALEAAAQAAYARGADLDTCCQRLYERARRLGYEATIGVQEVSTRSMPSFPGEIVTSALMLVDLQEAAGKHRR